MFLHPVPSALACIATGSGPLHLCSPLVQAIPRCLLSCLVPVHQPAASIDHRPIIDLLFRHTSRPRGSVTFRLRSNTSARPRAHFFQEHQLQELLPILTLELSKRMLEDSWHLTRDDSPFVLRPFLISHNQATTMANTRSILSHWSPRCIDLPSSPTLEPRTSNSSRMADALCIQPMCPPDLQFPVALPGRLKPDNSDNSCTRHSLLYRDGRGEISIAYYRL
ncbi:hypothetical protein BKA70DRAFT_852575 [Coprinopsis sp. MPI-PUGE-AT-0042]|nr:hypothetical protein BKA70DRAFT_852575 [Coprinopsis sp. MPI-PUGE-AT-0042]